MKATARWPRVARENAITALRCAVASWFALWWLNAGIGGRHKTWTKPGHAWRASDVPGYSPQAARNAAASGASLYQSAIRWCLSSAFRAIDSDSRENQCFAGGGGGCSVEGASSASATTGRAAASSSVGASSRSPNRNEVSLEKDEGSTASALTAAWARDSRDSEAVASSLGEAVITQQQLSGQPNTRRTGEFECGNASCFNR